MNCDTTITIERGRRYQVAVEGEVCPDGNGLLFRSVQIIHPDFAWEGLSAIEQRRALAALGDEFNRQRDMLLEEARRVLREAINYAERAIEGKDTESVDALVDQVRAFNVLQSKRLQ